MTKVAVLIPCLNEEVTIAGVVADFKRALPQADIYVFDNNSTDATAQEATKAGATVINVSRQGKGRVVRAMFRQIDADVYVMVDGDGTYPPSNVAELIHAVEQGTDMVIGDRLSSTYFSENKRPLHNSGNRMVRALINRIFDTDIHDVLSGYRAFSHRFVKSIAVQSSGFEIETELTVFALVNDFNVTEVVVPYTDRATDSHSKLNTLRDGSRILRTVVKLFRDYKPMQFFGLIALLLAIIAIAFNIPVFIDYMHTGLVDRFPTLFCGGFMMLAALMLFCVGLILQVLSNRNKVIMDTLLKNYDK